MGIAPCLQRPARRTCPGALRQLASATTAAEARTATWRINNHVVAQGELFEAAEYVVPFVLQILLSGSAPVQLSALDLLIELTGPAAYVAAEEKAVGNVDLLDHCRARAKEGLAIGYWLLNSEDTRIRGGAVAFLDSIETDRRRLTWILTRFAELETDSEVRELALRVVSERQR